MRAFISMACTVAVIGFTTPAAAQGKAGGAKVKTTSATPVHGSSAKPAATAKTTTTTKTKVAGHGPTKTADAGTTTGHAKTRTTTADTSTPATTTTSSGITLTPVQQKLEKNTNLASKLQSRLPPGIDLNTAAAGFRNLGQFVAAVNVSNNLGLDFTTMKTAMVTDGKSLGQAIQAQKGTSVDAQSVAARAERDADTMIRSTDKKDSKSAKRGDQ